MSEKRKASIRQVIHIRILQARMMLNLEPEEDLRLAHEEDAIYDEVMNVLNPGFVQDNRKA